MYHDFLIFLQNTNQEIFIDVEGKREKIGKFIVKYNDLYGQTIGIGDEGICLLGEGVDKWSIELRVYFNDPTGLPVYWNGRKYRNRNYRSDEYNYRLDDNKLMWFLFDNGYQLGHN